MRVKTSVAVLVLLVVCSLAFSLALRNNFGSKARLINDYSDRGIYAAEGAQLLRSGVPYTGAFSEYPQIALYFFAVPHLIIAWIDPRNNLHLDYSTIFSLLMMVFCCLSISILYRLLNRQKYLAFLLLLPASFYFTFNRFDSMACFATLFSVYLFSKGHYNLSALFLSVGTFIKWYPALVLPALLMCYVSIHKRIPWSMLITFGLASLVIVLPTLATGGIAALIFPYKFHVTTGLNNESLLSLLDYVVHRMSNITLVSQLVLDLFLILQFSIIPLCLTSRVDSLDKVVRWSALAILVFILFAKFDSPQWILWIIPFLILKARRSLDVLWIILFDLVTYIGFPIGFDLAGETSEVFRVIVLVKIGFLLGFIVPLMAGLLKDNLVFAFIQQRLNAYIHRKEGQKTRPEMGV
jgi:hypothetical protein